MKIVLIVTNSNRKNLVFISNELDVCSLEKAIQLTHKKQIKGAHVVQQGNNTYIRTNPSVVKSEEFDTLSVTLGNLLLYAQNARLTKLTPALRVFIDLYLAHLKKNAQLINPVGQPQVLAISVRKKLVQHKDIVFEAAEVFGIDPYLIGAILVDEIARLDPFEEIIDIFGVQIIGGNTSIGIGQVKTDTANGIIKQGLYNPNHNDPKLPFKKLDKTARVHLYTYLIQPKHNIFFSTAYIKSIIDFWASTVDLRKRPEIVATLYSKGYGEPKTNPQPSERGTQIVKEFYPLAKKWLG